MEETKSLYNLIKPSYVISQKKEETRVINSNDRLKKIEEQIAREKTMPVEGDFVDGLPAKVVEVKNPEDLLEEAELKKTQLLKDAQIQIDNMKEQANKELEKLKKEAYDVGFNQGRSQGKAQIEHVLAEKSAQLDQQAEVLAEDYKQKFDRMEGQLVDTILTVLDKVLHIQLTDKRNIVYRLVDDAIANVGSCKMFEVYVNDVNLVYIDEHMEDLKAKVGKDVTIEVIKDPTLSNEQCRIETNTGTYDCGFDTCYDNLVKDIKSLSIKVID